MKIISSSRCGNCRTERGSAAPLVLHAYSQTHVGYDLDCSGSKDVAKQSFKDECDINTIMAKYIRSGVLDFVAKHEPRYGDCTGQDFQEAKLLVAGAMSMFQDLPAAVRARFDNDPGAFLDFIDDPDSREEARELGLLRPDAVADTPPKGQAAKPPEPILEAPKGGPKA